MKLKKEAKTKQEFDQISAENWTIQTEIELKAYNYANGNGPPLNITEISKWIAIQSEKLG